MVAALTVTITGDKAVSRRLGAVGRELAGKGIDVALRAAALAAEGIASSELMIQKVITILDLKTDGAKVAAEWRMKAKQWRELYESALGEADEAFDWAEIVYDPFSARERVAAQALRA